ncbi:MAG: hypothetical protein HXY40_04725 [Chloroflexi bacterium]|nr:hypothetical protein [Chloroflexota bacterium]
MLQILFIIFGVLALTRSELKISRNRVITGQDAKVLGVIMIAGAALGFFLGPWVILGTLVIVIVYGLARAQPIA